MAALDSAAAALGLLILRDAAYEVCGAPQLSLTLTVRICATVHPQRDGQAELTRAACYMPRCCTCERKHEIR